MFGPDDLKYLQEMENRLSNNIQEIEQSLSSNIQEIEQRLSDSIQRSAEQTLKQATDNMRVLIENYVDPKLNLLAEGQKTILETMTPKSKVEELENESDLLKMAIRSMSADIAELKKAQ